MSNADFDAVIARVRAGTTTVRDADILEALLARSMSNKGGLLCHAETVKSQDPARDFQDVQNAHHGFV